MAEKTVDVRTRLKLDDLATALLGKIQSGFQKTDAEQKKAQGGFKAFASQAASAFLAFNAVGAAKGVLEYGKSFITAAAGAESGKREFAAVLDAVQGIPFAQAQQQAAKLGEEFQAVALKTGVAAGDIREGFSTIIEATGASAEGIARAKKEVADMATIAGVMGKSTGDIAREFGFMQEGILRTRGQLFQMLRHTGVFGDSVKGAADAWAKLTEEERAKKLEQGLGKIAVRFQGIKPGFNQMIGQLEAMYGSLKKDVGQPIMEALTPGIEKLVQAFSAARPEIRAYAKAIGVEAGTWVTGAAKSIERGFEYLKTHEQEIRAAISEGVDKARALVEFVLAHKEEIALAFGAKAVLPGAIGAGKAVASGVGSYLGAAKGGVGALGLGASAVGSAAALAALSAAIVGVGLAVWQGEKFLREYADATDTIEKKYKTLSDLAKAGDTGQLERTLNTQRLVLIETGKLDHGFTALAAALRATAEQVQNNKLVMGGVRANRIKNEMAMITDAYKTASSVHTAAADQLADSIAVKGAQALAESFNEASKAGDQASATFAAQTLGSSRILVDALIKAGIDVEGGFGGLADTLMASGVQFADVAGRLRAAAGGTAAPAKQVVNMSGGQTFKINQEFRDSDPDKIAVVFRRDVLRAATNRYQASSTSPFGT